MNELWYDDLSLKSEDIKILPIKFEYLIGRHFKKWGVYFFTRFWEIQKVLWKTNIIERVNNFYVCHLIRWGIFDESPLTNSVKCLAF